MAPRPMCVSDRSSEAEDEKGDQSSEEELLHVVVSKLCAFFPRSSIVLHRDLQTLPSSANFPVFRA